MLQKSKVLQKSKGRYGTPIGGCFPVKGGGGATWIVTKRGGWGCENVKSGVQISMYTAAMEPI